MLPLPLTREISIPTSLLYHPHLPPTVIHTWMQLRMLAESSSVTPPVTLADLSELTYKSGRVLYRHLAFLRFFNALAVRYVAPHQFVIHFPPNFSVEYPPPVKPPGIPLTHTPFPDLFHILRHRAGKNVN